MPHANTEPSGRGATRWFLFLAFLHLLPVPWLSAVAVGLAPAIFLLAGGLVSLFNTHQGSLAFAGRLLIPALAGGTLFFFAAHLLSGNVVRLGTARKRTLALALVLLGCTLLAMLPVFRVGAEGRPVAFGLLDFPRLLIDFGIPGIIWLPYLVALILILSGLLEYQHVVAGLPKIPGRNRRRLRKIKFGVAMAGFIILLDAFVWTHRTLLIVTPLAHSGYASAQFHLAMALKAHPGAEYHADIGYLEWLERAAVQGHVAAAWQLAQDSRSTAEKRRWLGVAAEGGHPAAQYWMYRVLMHEGLTEETAGRARQWLQKSADQGHAEAQNTLAEHLNRGHTQLEIAQNLAQARQLWEKAARGGSGHAMEALAWRYARGADGFPFDLRWAVDLYRQIAIAYTQGGNGLPKNTGLAESRQAQADDLSGLAQRLAANDPQTQADVGRRLLGSVRASSETILAGVALMEKAAEQGDPQVQYELGDILLFGRHGVSVDLPRGRRWWNLAIDQNHVKTMEYVAPAYQNGRFGYPVDLLKSKAIVARLVRAYEKGQPGVPPNPDQARYWRKELAHFDRLFHLAGGTYLPLADLRARAAEGDAAAQYQLGRQMMVSGPPEHRRKGLKWIERAAEGGHAEAQYRLVTYFEGQAGIMRTDPQRGLAFLKAAAEQKHLPAMGALALAYYKGRHGLVQDRQKAREWYLRLLRAYESGDYLGEINDRFIPFQRRQLTYVNKALGNPTERLD